MSSDLKFLSKLKVKRQRFKDFLISKMLNCNYSLITWFRCWIQWREWIQLWDHQWTSLQFQDFKKIIWHCYLWQLSGRAYIFGSVFADKHNTAIFQLLWSWRTGKTIKKIKIDFLILIFRSNQVLSMIWTGKLGACLQEIILQMVTKTNFIKIFQNQY